MRWFEDVEVGSVRTLGPIVVEREDAIDFARKYDPQPFHLDDAAAAAHPFFGRLAISGWNTCALVMRLLVDDMTATGAKSLGSPGVDEIRWTRPVYPGDALTLELEVVSARRSESRPEMGSTYQHYRLLNQDGVVVMTMKGAGLWRTRPV
jgi:acyl dehydratase